ncbi:hypothetical protein [Longitalea luteola]|nr:hypothetical protein [Longitalea luteola]
MNTPQRGEYKRNKRERGGNGNTEDAMQAVLHQHRLLFLPTINFKL